MAATFEDQSFPGDQLIHKWTLGDGDTGEAKRIGAYPDKSFGIWGTWNTATVVIQGSWDNPNGTPSDASWFTLTEVDNSTAISKTTDDKGVILESPVWIRPKSSGGGGSAAINVVIAATWRRNF